MSFVKVRLAAIAFVAAGCELFPSLDGLAGACTITPSFADAGATLRVAGSAELRDGYVELTASRETQAGLLAYRTALDLRSSQISFDLSLTRVASSVGMGVAVALLDTPADQLACATDYPLCVLGATAGVAVIIRTAQRDNLQPQAPFIAVVDTSADPKAPIAAGASAPLPAGFVQTLASIDDASSPPEASWHAMTIDIAGGFVDVTVDGVALLTHVALPRPVPAPSTWAMGGSTDQVGLGLLAEERAAVRAVKVSTSSCH